MEVLPAAAQAVPQGTARLTVRAVLQAAAQENLQVAHLVLLVHQ